MINILTRDFLGRNISDIGDVNQVTGTFRTRSTRTVRHSINHSTNAWQFGRSDRIKQFSSSTDPYNSSSVHTTSSKTRPVSTSSAFSSSPSSTSTLPSTGSTAAAAASSFQGWEYVLLSVLGGVFLVIFFLLVAYLSRSLLLGRRFTGQYKPYDLERDTQKVAHAVLELPNPERLI